MGLDWGLASALRSRDDFAQKRQDKRMEMQLQNQMIQESERSLQQGLMIQEKVDEYLATIEDQTKGFQASDIERIKAEEVKLRKPLMKAIAEAKGDPKKFLYSGGQGMLNKYRRSLMSSESMLDGIHNVQQLQAYKKDLANPNVEARPSVVDIDGKQQEATIAEQMALHAQGKINRINYGGASKFYKFNPTLIQNSYGKDKYQRQPATAQDIYSRAMLNGAEDWQARREASEYIKAVQGGAQPLYFKTDTPPAGYTATSTGLKKKKGYSDVHGAIVSGFLTDINSRKDEEGNPYASIREGKVAMDVPSSILTALGSQQITDKDTKIKYFTPPTETKFYSASALGTEINADNVKGIQPTGFIEYRGDSDDMRENQAYIRVKVILDDLPEDAEGKTDAGGFKSNSMIPGFGEYEGEALIPISNLSQAQAESINKSLKYPTASGFGEFDVITAARKVAEQGTTMTPYAQNQMLQHGVNNVSYYQVYADEADKYQKGFKQMTPESIMELVDDVAAKTAVGIDQNDTASLIKAMIGIESGYNPLAINNKSGAMGLGQFLPSTAESRNIDNPFDVDTSIDGMFNYFYDNYNTFGDPIIAALAYHTGEGNMQEAINILSQKGVDHKTSDGFIDLINTLKAFPSNKGLKNVDQYAGKLINTYKSFKEGKNIY